MLSVGTTVLRNYRVERILEGGMGLVYVCSPQSEWDQPSVGPTPAWVAVKTMRTESYVTGGNHANYQREIAIAGSLPPHPYLIECLQVTGLEDVPGIVMPYAIGGTLRDRIVSAPLSLTEVVTICRQLCAAFSFLHAMDIVHRDIKPENVLFKEPGHARVADFGLAGMQSYALSLLREDTSLQVPSSRHFIGGTLPYMSPEQFGDGEVTPRSDIYSFGVLLHELLTGQVPAMISPDHRTRGHFRRQTTLSDDRRWPRELRMLVERCLQWDAAVRFSDFDEVDRELAQVVEIAHLDVLKPLRPSLAELEAEMTADDWSRRGTAFSQLSRRNEARICHEKAYEMAPSAPGKRLNLGRTLLGLGQQERGLRLVEEEAEANPGAVEVQLLLADTYGRLGRWPEVVHQCEKAIVLMPDSLSAHRTLATALRHLGKDKKFEETIEKMMRVLDESPLLNNPAMWINGGVMFGLDGEFRSSAKFLEESVRRFPDNIDGWHNLAVTRVFLREFGAAVDAADQVLQLCPEPAQTWFLLGFLGLMTGEEFGGTYYWGQLVGRFPEHTYSQLAVIGMKAALSSSDPETINIVINSLLERSGYLYFRS
jgi:serine/threonine protein kinase